MRCWDGEVVCFDAEGKPRFYEISHEGRGRAFSEFHCALVHGFSAERQAPPWGEAVGSAARVRVGERKRGGDP